MALIPVFLRTPEEDRPGAFLCQSEPDDLPKVVESVVAYDLGNADGDRHAGDTPNATVGYFTHNGKAGFEIVVS